ncbi:TIGR04222 domain-containing membrane protein [Lentzea sp. NPDC051213]|uniref:TIGR04222 domain-containing membrane protein n=1 Tax=Lentzea sp. NPDC051213 TaxID=3364126 RepID=UPI0037B82CE4
MAKSSTTTGLSVEEIGFLAGGPGRAAEAALARLMDGGLVRVSREGLVTAVYQNGYGATTAIEAYLLAGINGSSRPISQVVRAAAGSQEMGSLRRGLVDRAMVRRQWGKARGGANAFRTLLFLLAVASAVAGGVFDKNLWALSAVLVFFVFLMRDKGMLTPIGNGALKYAARNVRGRVDAVAVHGLRGTTRGQRISDLYGLPANVIHFAPPAHGKMKSTSNGCSTVYEHHHYNCGGTSSSCSSSSCSSSSSCGSSSSSCSSSSSSSCSSSSCSSSSSSCSSSSS